jgi:hypothetical protein
LGANELFKKTITSSGSQLDEIYDCGSHEWIWSNHVDYSSPVSKAHWMEAPYLLPVIADKYQIPHLVLYDNSGTHTKNVDGSRYFTTSVYCHDKLKCCVSTNTRPGLVHDIVASMNACMVFFCEQSHFMLLQYN